MIADLLVAFAVGFAFSRLTNRPSPVYQDAHAPPSMAGGRDVTPSIPAPYFTAGMPRGRVVSSNPCGSLRRETGSVVSITPRGWRSRSVIIDLNEVRAARGRYFDVRA